MGAFLGPKIQKSTISQNGFIRFRYISVTEETFNISYFLFYYFVFLESFSVRTGSSLLLLLQETVLKFYYSDTD